MIELKKRGEFTRFENEKVLLIGGAGFIGSHLAEQLAACGAHIFVLDNLSVGCKENLEEVPHVLFETSIEEANLLEILTENQISRVFHLACGSLVASLKNPERDFVANAVNTFKSLEAFRQYKQGQAFVFCSTGSVYGEPEEENYTEDEPLKPSTPYGTSKACGDLYARLYHKFYGLPIKIVRYNNIYGPRKHGTAIPVFIQKALHGEVITIEGGKQVKTPTFVLDAVEATMLASVKDEATGESLNISSWEAFSVEEMVNVIWKQINGEESPPRVEYSGYRPGEIMVLKPSVEKARKILGWQASFTLAEGLRVLIDFLKNENE